MNLKNQRLLTGQSFINSLFIDANKQKTFSVTNPYNGEHIMEVADCGASETKVAITQANEAFASWRQLTGTERGAIL